LTARKIVSIPENSAALFYRGGNVDRRSCGVMNPYLQQLQLPNLFVLGASTFPNIGSANPTPTILALTYRNADAFVDRYLKKPAPLA